MRVRIATTLSMRWRVWPLGCAVVPVHVASIKSAVHAWATLGCWATGRPRVLLIKWPATCSVHEGVGGRGVLVEQVGQGSLGNGWATVCWGGGGEGGEEAAMVLNFTF